MAILCTVGGRHLPELQHQRLPFGRSIDSRQIEHSIIRWSDKPLLLDLDRTLSVSVPHTEAFPEQSSPTS